MGDSEAKLFSSFFRKFFSKKKEQNSFSKVFALMKTFLPSCKQFFSSSVSLRREDQKLCGKKTLENKLFSFDYTSQFFSHSQHI
jgi:hypothetical protein